MNGRLTLSRYIPAPAGTDQSVPWCYELVFVTDHCEPIRIRSLLAPEFMCAQSVWALIGEAVDKAAMHAEGFREAVKATTVEYTGASQHCCILHAEGYIHETAEMIGSGKKMHSQQPAIRIVIGIGGDKIIPCCDALPELHSVNDWAQGFSEIVADKIRLSGGRVDPDALRSEFAKIARSAILAMDRDGASDMLLPVLTH